MPTTIAQAARAAGVGVETIRFYERRGLIQQPPRPNGKGFRTYPEETVRRVRLIRQAQELGFSLREAGELLDLKSRPDSDAAAVHARAAAKLREVNEKLETLQSIRDTLEALVSACPQTGKLCGCAIMEALIGGESNESAPHAALDRIRP
jgi:MerR family copper efflux transcriptional regulator